MPTSPKQIRSCPDCRVFWRNVINREPAFMEEIQIKELIEYIARCLAEHPEQVAVKEVAGLRISVLELHAAKEDLGKDNRQGRQKRPRNAHHHERGCNEAQKTRRARDSRISGERWSYSMKETPSSCSQLGAAAPSGCFGDGDKVCPLDEEGVMQPQSGCLPCPHLRACVRM